ncbi:MAG TPA: PASTA domain-containing protein, partial [Candidatus Acidoferrum sp.]|nr:PASTA domain-containing protein [Candidatus Acidoferrum sp.]
PVGLHQGGQVSAPVFRRVTQQVLEYLHVPHDLPLAPKSQLLMAKVKENDLDDDTPDHPGEPLETAEVNNGTSDAAKPNVARAPSPVSADRGANVVQAAVREPLPESTTPSSDASAQIAAIPEAPLPKTGTVVLDVEQGGIEVPSLVGKTVRGALEAAQDAGLELEPVGSGVARQQTPAAGAHVPAGARVTVQFGR